MGKPVRIIGKNTIDPWQAPDGTRWVVVLTWGEVDGRAECIGLELRSFAADEPGATVSSGDEVRPVRRGADVRPVRADVLRRFPMGEVDRARSQWAALLSPDGLLGSEQDAGRDHTAFAARQGRRLVGADGEVLSVDAALSEVARIYREAWQVGREPTLAVAEALSLSRSAAAKRVARARERGHLPPTTRGRPTGATNRKDR